MPVPVNDRNRDAGQPRRCGRFKADEAKGGAAPLVSRCDDSPGAGLILRGSELVKANINTCCAVDGSRMGAENSISGLGRGTSRGGVAPGPGKARGPTTTAWSTSSERRRPRCLCSAAELQLASVSRRPWGWLSWRPQRPQPRSWRHWRPWLRPSAPRQGRSS